MSDPLSSLDLKFLPDWLKETTAPKKYADHPGASPRESRGSSARGDQSGRGGPRRDGGGRRENGPGAGPRRDDRRGGPEGRGGQRQDSRDRRGQGHPERRQSEGRQGPARTEALPVPVKIQFVPEPNAASNIAKQIRQSAKAYPLFGTARMFLEKPERHALRITSSDAAHPLQQLNDGPIAFERSLLDRNAFRSMWQEFYKEEVTEVDPPKGNYTSVALCRSTGTFLGPTNYHGYQVAIRRLYEERFSRRMSFPEFQRSEVEVVTSEEAVADWKAEISKQTSYHTLKEAEVLQFKTLQEAEAHFRKHYLPTLIKSATTLECNGKAARDLPERALLAAAREAFDKELAYPGGLVHGLRNFFDEQGLQVFKHRKRVLYVSAIRPKRATDTSGFADGPATLLSVIGEAPRISKRDLAIKILGATNPEEPETPEHTARKTQLAADLHYLVRAGHVIEFADGRLDLPLAADAAGSKADAAAAEEEEGHEESDAVSNESAAPTEDEILSTAHSHSEESPEPIADASAPVSDEGPFNAPAEPPADHGSLESPHHEALESEEAPQPGHPEHPHSTAHDS